MKKQIVTLLVLSFLSVNIFAQLSSGEIQILQDYFGTEKTILVKEYMGFTPQQDSLFWPIYQDYESQRLELGKERISIVEDYLKKVENVSQEDATNLVNKTVALEMSFKKHQKKYFKTFSKKIGSVKSAQFFQFENYLNNVINLSIQQSIPFVGELEQKHSEMPKKK